MFLHRGAAFGVPLRAGTPLQPHAGTDRPAGLGGDEDLVAAEALRQFRTGVRAQIEGRGEGARQAASALRVMAAHARAQGLDDQFRRMLQREVETYGRDGVLWRHISPARVAADAREFGLDPAPGLVSPDMATRRLVLESLLTLGITPHLLTAAEHFDRAGAHLDARGTSARGQVAGGEALPGAGVREWVSRAETAMTIACFSPSAATCAFFAGIYVGARIHHADPPGVREGVRGAFQEFG